MHSRKTIRDLVVQALTGLPTTGSNVKASRIYTIDAQEMPCLSVYCGEEELLEDSIEKGCSGVINMNLHIDIQVESNTDFDDQLDEILSEIQVAISIERSNNTEGSLSEETVGFMYLGCEEPEYMKGERTQASMRVNYLVQYEQQL